MSILLYALCFQLSGMTRGAVWNAPPGFQAQVHTACAAAGEALPACFQQHMKERGASAAAIAFAREIGGTGYMTALRRTGKLSVGAAVEPFRANENDLLFLIADNAKPMDVDDDSKLHGERGFQDVVKEHPGVLMWPGDRSSVEAILVLRGSDGGQEFVTPYVLSTCHACARIGKAFFAFRFDANGRFSGSRFGGMLAIGDTAANQYLVTLPAGETKTLLLPGNPSTGYSWFSDIDGKLEAKAGGPGKLMGAPQEQEFALHAPATGERAIQFSYARPWDERPKPAKHIEVIVRAD